MKHPVRDRILVFLCALVALCGAVGLGGFAAGYVNLAAESFDFSGGVLNLPVIKHLQSWSSGDITLYTRVAMIAVAALLLIIALLLFGVMLPSKRKRSSNFAIQRNENGMVRISLKAIETLVQKCLNQHAELKVVTSSLYSDEETIRVDVHIMLQSDISMPLAISALQKQIKRYLEACSGVTVEEVRVFVDGTTPATEATAQSPYAIPASLLGLGPDALPSGGQAEPAAQAEPIPVAEPVSVPVEPVAQEEPAVEAEPAFEEETPEEAQDAVSDEQEKGEGDWA